MAKVCYFTGRKTVSGNNRSHAMNQTKRAVKPNLQKVTVLIDGKPKKVWASAQVLFFFLHFFSFWTFVSTDRRKIYPFYTRPLLW